MKKLIILLGLFLITFASNTFAQEKKEEPEFATLVIYREIKMPLTYSLKINSSKIVDLTYNGVCYYKLYSKGDFLFTLDAGMVSTSYNLNIEQNDTIYLFIDFEIVNHKTGNMKIQSTEFSIDTTSKSEFNKFIATNSKTKYTYFKQSEDLASPFFPNSFKNSIKKEKTGTGFLISDKGYIVTNHHVIDNADKITISGVNGNFNSELSAKLVLKDEASDLAILKIEDRILIDPVPYVIVPEQIAIGENIFLLGFPYIKTMGTDVKLTNGIVSSKSGYEGNINSYQVSAPVQPGNSGGPVFDANGRIIAIVNAKHTLAENASYAIKSKYLLDLLENLDEKIELNKTNQLAGLTLPQQVEKAQPFVVIIKTK